MSLTLHEFGASVWSMFPDTLTVEQRNALSKQVHEATGVTENTSEVTFEQLIEAIEELRCNLKACYEQQESIGVLKHKARIRNTMLNLLMIHYCYDAECFIDNSPSQARDFFENNGVTIQCAQETVFHNAVYDYYNQSVQYVLTSEANKVHAVAKTLLQYASRRPSLATVYTDYLLAAGVYNSNLLFERSESSLSLPEYLRIQANCSEMFNTTPDVKFIETAWRDTAQKLRASGMREPPQFRVLMALEPDLGIPKGQLVGLSHIARKKLSD